MSQPTNRAARFLEILVLLAFIATCAAGVLMLVGLPVVRWFSGDGADLIIKAHANVGQLDSVLQAQLPAGVRLESMEASVGIEVGAAPTWLLVTTWLGGAVLVALALLFLRDLRKLLRSVSAGAPFARENTHLLRRLGVLLLGLSLYRGLADFTLSLMLSRVIEGSGDLIGSSLRFGPGLWVALVLIALAEVFRHGAALEEEQALVV